MKKIKEEDNSSLIFMILLGFSIAFIIASLFAGDIGNLIPGFLTICSRPSQFTMDYFVLGGLGSAFLNTGMVGLACCGLIYFTKAKCTGTTVAAYWLNVGFSTFGMTFSGIWPFFFGVWVYSRIKKVPFKSVVNFAMFSTALSPFVMELIFRYPNMETRGFSFIGLLLAIVLGVVVGCVMPPLCEQAKAFHKGYDLYNAGPAAGFLAFLICCILYRSPGVELPSNTELGDGHRLFVNVFFLIVFFLCLVFAWLLDKNCFRDYRKLWASDGYQTDYTSSFGMPATLVNMAFYGFFILLYFNIVHGMTVTDGHLVFTGAKFTGATMGAIMCMFAFCAAGAQPRTVFPIAVGYAAASFLPFFMYIGGITAEQNWTLTTQSILVGMCFASGLAPISGKYGFWAGVAAGAMHAILVTSVPLLHGSFCLYNGGFTCGIVAFLLVPVLECFFKTKEERHSKTL